MIVELKKLNRGDVFVLAGIKWKVLKKIKFFNNINNYKYFCESVEDVFHAAFDDKCNNWKFSDLRERLNGEFLENLEKKRHGIREAIVPTYRDLTSDDGLNDYGFCFDMVTILTADEYRETRDLHPAPEHWRWLITADGTPASSGTSYVLYVNSDGSLDDNYAYNGYCGVRPALTLKSDILVSVDDGEDQPEELEEMSQEQREMAIYEKAVSKWGKRAQALKAIEEMSELSQAILKLVFFEDFGIGDEETIRENISKERADVEIMLNQLHVIFGDNSEMEQSCLNDLEKRLRGEV